MHVFFFNIPWIIDQSDYNCSSRTLAEWKERGSVNQYQAVYFSISGTIFLITYIVALVGMARSRLLRVPCYQLMFFNGMIDILNVLVGSFIVSYIDFTGQVFCSNIAFGQFTGHIGWSAWMGSTFSCIVLAINRVVEMMPSMRSLRFLFKGCYTRMWMILCVLIMIIRPFITRPTLFNSSAGAFMAAPFISDDVQWEISYYTSLVLPLHNISVIVILSVLYSVLCFYVIGIGKMGSTRISKVQAQLFLQALIICVSTAVASLLYVVLVFVPVHRSIVIAANIVWQISHGIHGVVYICINKNIREEVVGIFRRTNRAKASIASSPPTLTVLPSAQE